MIYFIRAQSGEGPIKIGYASHLASNRLQGVQANSPVLLMVVAVIAHADMKDEYALHKRFEAQRLWAEWFEPTPELLALIDDLRKVGHEEQDTRFVPNPHRGNWHPHHHGLTGDGRRHKRWNATKVRHEAILDGAARRVRSGK